MASIIFRHVDFSYPAAASEVFRDLSVLIDSAWRTALVGRNGQGKTTLMRLIAGQLQPTAGELDVPVPVRVWSGGNDAAGAGSTREVVRGAVAPFGAWEVEMAHLLEQANEPALARYGEVLARYEACGGYRIDAAIAREFDAMGLAADLLERPFASLSGGEQTRALIVALFLDESSAGPGVYPLIDEPTNHLDADGRAALMCYLAAKPGFLLVSHDRRFLDGAADHVLSLNRSDVRLTAGSFSQWRAQMDQELETQRRTRERIERDVARLTEAARETRRHAHDRESDKYRTGALDKGFIGARAARQMRRARSVERRIESELDEKRGLLANQEKQRRLRVQTSRGEGAVLVAQNLLLAPGNVPLCQDLSLSVQAGERIAVIGPNGCGKTTLLNALAGSVPPAAGAVHRPGYVTVAQASQQPLWRHGDLRQRLRDAGLEESRFRQLLGVLGVDADACERDLASLSDGQRKKIDLCRTLMAGADLLLWDEPLNYVDLFAREQIEQAILRDRPTLVFVEHDAEFVGRVATAVVRLGGAGATT